MPIFGGNPRHGLHYPFSQYEIVYSNPAMNPGANAIQSTGSGVTYWPARDKFLLLDNQPYTGNPLLGPTIYEFNKDGSYLRKILVGDAADLEDIHWISGNDFLIARERNLATPSADELMVITLPDSDVDDEVNDNDVIRHIFPAGLTSVSNRGIEAACVVGDFIYFTTEQTATTPAEWTLWRVQNAGGPGSVTPTAERVFNLKGVLSGIATDISGMTYGPDGNFWLLSDEGAVAGGKGRLIRVTMDGRLVEQSTLPSFAAGIGFAAAEGIDFFRDTDGVQKLLLSGEHSTGVDFMILKPPTP